MRLTVIQTKAVKGDVAANWQHHKELIALSKTTGSEMVVFPELSLTGYEPELAGELAFEENEDRFTEIQALSDAENIILCEGMPQKKNNDLFISMLVFRPGQPLQIYSKQYLHSDEEEFFTGGKQQLLLENGSIKIAPALCYEIMSPLHAEMAGKMGANLYLVSGLYAVKSIGERLDTLSSIAQRYKMNVLMSNYVGQSGGYDAAGNSSAWNSKGELLEQLDGSEEGIITFDTETGETVKKTFRKSVYA